MNATTKQLIDDWEWCRTNRPADAGKHAYFKARLAEAVTGDPQERPMLQRTAPQKSSHEKSTVDQIWNLPDDDPALQDDPQEALEDHIAGELDDGEQEARGRAEELLARIAANDRKAEELKRARKAGHFSEERTE